MNGSPYPNLRAGPLPHGHPRRYAQAVADGVIDPRVRGLVAAMNIDGLCATFASCEGHGLLRCEVPPYVGLNAGTEFMCAVSRMLEKDAARNKPRLHYYWTLSGVFDREGELRFLLAPGQNMRGWWATVRRKLDEDFRTLSQLMQVLTERWQSDPAELERKRKQEHDEGGSQHSPELPSSIHSIEPDRVTAPTTRTSLGACADGGFAFLTGAKRHVVFLGRLALEARA